jgi:hypothetical protein
MAMSSSNTVEFDLSDEGAAKAVLFVKDYMKAAADFRLGMRLSEAKLSLTVGIESPNYRLSNAVYLAELAHELQHSSKQVSIYSNALYRTNFDFRKRSYTWLDKEIYLTPAEELLLYKLLLADLKPGVASAKATLYRLRVKFGEKFPGKDVD